MRSVVCLACLLAVLFASSSEGQDANCTLGAIRLYNSSAPGQGMVQLCNSSNQWSAVCNIYWSCSDAKVACRQLGFDVYRPNHNFPHGYFGTWDSMPGFYYSCSSSDESLQDCDTEPTMSCNITEHPNRMAGVACHPPLGNCTHGELRLVGGDSESEGRVEVCYKGGWYSVCGTEAKEASVMCKQLGYTLYPGAAVFVDDERFEKTPSSQGYVKFECSDQFSESNWTECTIKDSCDECRGDAIKCFNDNCTTGDIRLYNSSAPGQGMVQLCNSSNQWSAVCNINWDCTDAKVACRQLGFDVYRPDNDFPHGYFGTWDSMPGSYYSCSSSDESLEDCDKVLTPLCNITKYPNRMAGVACHPPLGNCTHGDLRLVGGESESEGRVEVCYKGGWYSVCETDDEEASVMCKQLGYTLYPWAAVFVEDERFGQTPSSQGYVKFECSDQFSESNWTECTIKDSCNKCRGDAIKCFTPRECEEGSLRLMDGDIDNEGRVEICLKGVWGTVLSNSNWTSLEAHIACKQVNLGNSGKKPVAYGDTSTSRFGDGKQPQVMYGPSCFGWENTLTDCSYTPYGSFDYSRSSTAGIFCFDDCKQGEVRLVGGASASEGTVEVCLGNLWGLVADSGWSLTNAQVVCSQLGFPLHDVRVAGSSQYGKPKKPVHLSSVYCSGTEQHILSCTLQEVSSLDEKIAYLNQVEVAGVICQLQSSTVNPTTENPTTENPTNNSTRVDSCSQTSTATVLAPTLVIALLLTAVIVLIISALGVIYWKRKRARNTEITKQLPLDNQQGTLPSRYELGSRQPRIPIPDTPTIVQTTAMEREDEDSGPLYECPDPLEDYTEMS